MTRTLRDVATARHAPSARTAELVPAVLRHLEDAGSVRVGDAAWNSMVEDLGVSPDECYRAAWNLVLAKRATRAVDTDDLGRLRWRFEIADGLS
jgi:hypothetical protein